MPSTEGMVMTRTPMLGLRRTQSMTMLNRVGRGRRASATLPSDKRRQRNSHDNDANGDGVQRAHASSKEQCRQRRAKWGSETAQEAHPAYRQMANGIVREDVDTGGDHKPEVDENSNRLRAWFDRVKPYQEPNCSSSLRPIHPPSTSRPGWPHE